MYEDRDRCCAPELPSLPVLPAGPELYLYIYIYIRSLIGRYINGLLFTGQLSKRTPNVVLQIVFPWYYSKEASFPVYSILYV